MAGFKKRHSDGQVFPTGKNGVNASNFRLTNDDDIFRQQAMSAKDRVGSREYHLKGEDYSQYSNLMLYNLLENSKNEDVKYMARTVLDERRTGRLHNPQTQLYKDQDRALFMAYGQKAESLLPKGSELSYMPAINSVIIQLPLTKNAAEAPMFAELVKKEVLVPMTGKRGRKMVGMRIDIPTFVKLLRDGTIMYGVHNLRFMLG